MKTIIVEFNDSNFTQQCKFRELTSKSKKEVIFNGDEEYKEAILEYVNDEKNIALPLQGSSVKINNFNWIVKKVNVKKGNTSLKKIVVSLCNYPHLI